MCMHAFTARRVAWNEPQLTAPHTCVRRTLRALYIDLKDCLSTARSTGPGSTHVLTFIDVLADDAPPWHSLKPAETGSSADEGFAFPRFLRTQKSAIKGQAPA